MDLFRNMGAAVSIKDSGSQAEQVKRLILKPVLLVCLGGSLGLCLELDYWELGFYFRLWHCVFAKKIKLFFQCLGLLLFEEYSSTSCRYVLFKINEHKTWMLLERK